MAGSPLCIRSLDFLVCILILIHAAAQPRSESACANSPPAPAFDDDVVYDGASLLQGASSSKQLKRTTRHSQTLPAARDDQGGDGSACMSDDQPCRVMASVAALPASDGNEVSEVPAVALTPASNASLLVFNKIRHAVLVSWDFLKDRVIHSRVQSHGRNQSQASFMLELRSDPSSSFLVVAFPLLMVVAICVAVFLVLGAIHFPVQGKSSPGAVPVPGPGPAGSIMSTSGSLVAAPRRTGGSVLSSRNMLPLHLTRGVSHMTFGQGTPLASDSNLMQSTGQLGMVSESGVLCQEMIVPVDFELVLTMPCVVSGGLGKGGRNEHVVTDRFGQQVLTLVVQPDRISLLSRQEQRLLGSCCLSDDGSGLMVGPEGQVVASLLPQSQSSRRSQASLHLGYGASAYHIASSAGSDGSLCVEDGVSGYILVAEPNREMLLQLGPRPGGGVAAAFPDGTSAAFSEVGVGNNNHATLMMHASSGVDAALLVLAVASIDRLTPRFFHVKR